MHNIRGQSSYFHCHRAHGKKTATPYQPVRDKGQMMKTDNVEQLKVRICGRKIVSVEPSMWSGEVKSLMKNQDYVSITLDDGTVLEVGGLYIRDGSGA